MTRRIALQITAAAAALSLFHSGGTAANAASPSGPDFIKEVKPLLENNCVRCHNEDKDKGNLRIDTKELFFKGGDTDTAAEPGNAARSLVFERITLPKGDDEIMPQETDPLSAEDIAILKNWIDAGAHWPDGITLSPPKKRAEFADSSVLTPQGPPQSPAEAAARLDRIIEHENAQNPHLPKASADPIDDLTFLRRVTIDLIGRIPTYDEIRDYEKLPTGTRRALTVDKLLAHPRFDDRWSVFMADMLRVRSNAEGGPQLLAYIHKSLKDGKPYDVLAKELVSANGKANNVPAVGFILGDEVNPMSLAGATAQIFLGVRLACAECHDHPFDDWEQMEFYELASFFGNTRRVENQFARSVYTTEAKESSVLWPPALENPESRAPVKPRFPFDLKEFDHKPDYIVRLEAKRAAEAAALAQNSKKGDAVDDLLDIDTSEKTRDLVPASIDVLKEVKKESRELDVLSDLYKASELRNKLAELITDPRNPYFGPAFVNRIWSEFNGSGFVEPLDNFSAYNAASHPMALDFLAREFIASGYDIRELIRIVTLSDTYRRGNHIPDTDLDLAEREDAERNFVIAKSRRMLSEVLYDSISVAGQLEEPKWKAGENIRTLTRQIRVPIVEDTPETPDPSPAATPDDAPKMEAMAMKAETPAMNGGGYDLEQTIALDFDEILKRQDGDAQEAAMMKEMADAELKRAAEMAAMREMERENAPPMRYELKTIEEKTDDNPSFPSSMRMASPAPPEHFLRVFGQPARQELGDFRDPSASLRQQLMMINGRATDKASLVGTLEPIYPLLVGPKADLNKAVRLAYLQILTREPSPDELADAASLISSAEDTLTGMSDLRWGPPQLPRVPFHPLSPHLTVPAVYQPPNLPKQNPQSAIPNPQSIKPWPAKNTTTHAAGCSKAPSVSPAPPSSGCPSATSSAFPAPHARPPQSTSSSSGTAAA